MMHQSVLNNIDQLGRATQRLVDRPAALIEQLQAELERVQADYLQWQKNSAAASPAKPARDIDGAQLDDAMAQLEQLRSELRRSEIARNAARSELRVVEARNTELQQELEALTERDRANGGNRGATRAKLADWVHKCGEGVSGELVVLGDMQDSDCHVAGEGDGGGEGERE